MAAQSRFKTKDRLASWGCCEDTSCLQCGKEIESHNHLFFYCLYSMICIKTIGAWLNINERHYNLDNS